MRTPWNCALAVIVAVGMAGLPGCEEDPYAKAVAAVSCYFNTAESTVTFQVGPLAGGTAVLGAGESAFWVLDGTAYVVNDAARALAPEISQAPDNIKYDNAFLEAVGNRRVAMRYIFLHILKAGLRHDEPVR